MGLLKRVILEWRQGDIAQRVGFNLVRSLKLKGSVVGRSVLRNAPPLKERGRY